MGPKKTTRERTRLLESLAEDTFLHRALDAFFAPADIGSSTRHGSPSIELHLMFIDQNEAY
jgi:hypothetical protein